MGYTTIIRGNVKPENRVNDIENRSHRRLRIEPYVGDLPETSAVSLSKRYIRVTDDYLTVYIDEAAGIAYLSRRLYEKYKDELMNKRIAISHYAKL